MIPIKIGTAFAHPFGPFVSSTDGYTIMSSLGIGTTNIRINPNGAAAWVSKSTATTPAYQELGYFLFTFTSTDFTVQGNHRVAVSMTSAGGALPVWEDFFASESSELAVALTSGARTTAIDLIWDEAVSGHTVAGSAGGNLQSATTAAALSAAGVSAVTTSVWAEALASHTTAGGAGKKLSDIVLTTTPDPLGVAVPGAYGAGTVGNLIGNNLLSATTAASLSAAGITSVTTAIWAEALASHTTAGSAGYYIVTNLLTPTSAAVLSAAGVNAVTTAIWAEALASHTTAGAAGKKLSDLAMSTDMGTALTNITTIDGIVDAIQAKTTNLPATPASSTDAMRLASTAIDLIWDEEIVVGHATTNTAGERVAAASAAAGLGTTGVRDAVWGAARATYASTGTFGELIDALWDEPIAGHLDAGSVGNALNAAGSAGDPWATAIPGAYTTAQAGGLLPNKLDAIQAKTTNLPASPASSTSILTWAMSSDIGTALANIAAIQAKTTNLPAAPASSTQILNWAMSTDMATALTDITTIDGIVDAIVAKTTNLPATPASSTSFLNWAMSTDMGTALTNITTIDGIVDAIQAKTTNLPATPASSTDVTGLMPSTGTTSIADAVWGAVNESTQSYADQVRNIRAALVGEAAGGGTASITFRDAADSINRLTFTATTDGNRTAVTILTT